MYNNNYYCGYLSIYTLIDVENNNFYNDCVQNLVLYININLIFN